MLLLAFFPPLLTVVFHCWHVHRCSTCPIHDSGWAHSPEDHFWFQASAVISTMGDLPLRFRAILPITTRRFLASCGKNDNGRSTLTNCTTSGAFAIADREKKHNTHHHQNTNHPQPSWTIENRTNHDQPPVTLTKQHLPFSADTHC